ncbi:Putative 115 kDa protein in type-1 retrotransposable element R1DM [Anthophora retusa]
MGKLLEKIIERRLQEDIQGRICREQYGFRKGIGTVEALEKVTKYIQNGLNKGSYVVGVSLDIKNAFNSVVWEKILDGLGKMRVKEAVKDIIRSCFKNRRAELEIEGGQIGWDIKRGVPQGSILGPTLWNVGYNDIISMNGDEGTVICCADDTIILNEGKDLGELIKKVEKRIREIVEEIEKLGLNVAAEKTEMVVFTKKRRKYGEIREIKLKGASVKAKTSMKYLGIRLDERLNYGMHFKEIYGKTMKVMNMMGILLGNTKGPLQKKRELLVSVGRSILLYGAPMCIWGDRTNIGKNREMIDKISRVCALRIAAAYRTVSTEAAEIIAGSPPLDLIVEMRKKKYERLKQLGVEDLSEREKGRVKRRIGKEVRTDMLNQWQERWETDTGKAVWTRSLIGDIRIWENRKHGQIDYFLTQFLSGHGAFNKYLHKFRKRESPMCSVCNVSEDAEHVILKCPRWRRERGELELREGEENVTPRKIINLMTRNKDKWKKYAEVVRRILRAKEAEERGM